jgi:HlyD family secretion protein
MAEQNHIFRKVSLERLSSPEQLDVLMRVTSAKGWVALLALCALLAAALAWGVFGSIPTKINGSCILIRPGGVSELAAPGAGRVADISVEVGDTVREGQVVARIERYDALDQIKGSAARLAELRAQQAKLDGDSQREARSQEAYLRSSEQSLDKRIGSGQQTVKALAAKIEVQSRLLEQGLITQQTLLGTRLDYANAQREVEGNRSDILKIGVSRLDADKQRQAERRALAAQIGEAERGLASQMRAANEVSRVLSPYNGRVLEIRLSENAMAGAGTPILTIEQTGASVNDLEARIYLAPLDGKKVRNNMDVQISPSTAKREEFGVMLGKVRSVAAFPASAEGMMRSLKNDKLVQQLAAGAAPIEVQSDLIPSATTASGYKWSSPQGPQGRIESGTMCDASITVRRQRPISLVIPLLRAELGV